MDVDQRTHKIGTHILYFMGHQVLNLIHYMILISMAAFFHFLLDHQLADIEDWIFDKSWEILGVCRALSAYLIFKFLSIRLEEREPFRKILSRFQGRPAMEVFVSIIFLLMAFCILGKPQGVMGNPTGLWKTIASYLGSSTMILSDCSVILMLNLIYPLKGKQWPFMVVLSALLSTLVIAILFQPHANDIFFLFFSMLMAYLLLRYDGRLGYVHSLLFCLLFFSPMVSLFGLDPLWKETYSFLPMENPIEGMSLAILGGVVLAYLTIRGKLFERT